MGLYNGMWRYTSLRDLRNIVVAVLLSLAEKAVREISGNPRLPYEVIGFVDDNPAKSGMRIHGIPVLGVADDLGLIAHQARAIELLIAVVSINGQQMKRLVGLCRETGLPFKVLPGLGELIDGKVSVKTSSISLIRICLAGKRWLFCYSGKFWGRIELTY